jgi:hypothetical protein
MKLGGLAGQYPPLKAKPRRSEGLGLSVDPKGL